MEVLGVHRYFHPCPGIGQFELCNVTWDALGFSCTAQHNRHNSSDELYTITTVLMTAVTDSTCSRAREVSVLPRAIGLNQRCGERYDFEVQQKRSMLNPI